MRPRIVTSVLLLLLALNAFGHAGEVHKYMGTVTTTHDDGSFTLKTTAGAAVRVYIAKTTAFRHADGHEARQSEITTGKRVVATISKDGRTASEIRISAKKK